MAWTFAPFGSKWLLRLIGLLPRTITSTSSSASCSVLRLVVLNSQQSQWPSHMRLLFQQRNLGVGIYTNAYDWQQITQGWTGWNMINSGVNLWFVYFPYEPSMVPLMAYLNAILKCVLHWPWLFSGIGKWEPLVLRDKRRKISATSPASVDSITHWWSSMLRTSTSAILTSTSTCTKPTIWLWPIEQRHLRSQTLPTIGRPLVCLWAHGNSENYSDELLRFALLLHVAFHLMSTIPKNDNLKEQIF